MNLIVIIFVNFLTFIRIIGVFEIVPIFLNYGGLAAALLTMFCYLTDFIDGYIARKYKACTFFGSAFDGIADKLFSIANLIILLTITKFSIFAILCEISIFVIQAVKFQKNINVQSSLTGKIKTWVIALTVIMLYLVTDINSLPFLNAEFQGLIASIDIRLLYGLLFIPLYIFEVATVISYLRFNPDIEIDEEEVTLNITEKFKKGKSLKNSLYNFSLVWFNYDFYMKYKDAPALKEILIKIEKNSK